MKILLIAFCCMGLHAETVVKVSLPENVQKELVDIIVPALENLYRNTEDCKVMRATVTVVYNPVALELHLNCVNPTKNTTTAKKEEP